MDILLFVGIGLVVGWAASNVLRRDSYASIGDFLFGVAGALLAGYLFQMFGLFPGGGTVGNLIVAAIGAAGLLALWRLFVRA